MSVDDRKFHMEQLWKKAFKKAKGAAILIQMHNKLNKDFKT